MIDHWKIILLSASKILLFENMFQLTLNGMETTLNSSRIRKISHINVCMCSAFNPLSELIKLFILMLTCDLCLSDH